MCISLILSSDIDEHFSPCEMLAENVIVTETPCTRLSSGEMVVSVRDLSRQAHIK